MKDYYKILNVKKNASLEKIKEKYKRRVKKYHPDKNKDPSAAEKFKLVSEAYSVLSDPYKRGKYDAYYENRKKSNDLFTNFEKMSLSFPKIPDIINNMDFNTSNSSSSFYSYSSTLNPDGTTTTTKEIKTNNNGKENNYYQKFVIDKDGNKKIIKEDGDKNLSIKKNYRNSLKLKDK